MILSHISGNQTSWAEAAQQQPAPEAASPSFVPMGAIPEPSVPEQYQAVRRSARHDAKG